MGNRKRVGSPSRSDNSGGKLANTSGQVEADEKSCFWAPVFLREGDAGLPLHYGTPGLCLYDVNFHVATQLSIKLLWRDVGIIFELYSQLLLPCQYFNQDFWGMYVSYASCAISTSSPTGTITCFLSLHVPLYSLPSTTDSKTSLFV